jgi:hypothetical protein
MAVGADRGEQQGLESYGSVIEGRNAGSWSKLVSGHGLLTLLTLRSYFVNKAR